MEMWDQLYKLDANGAMRTWQVEADVHFARYRIHHGVLGGAVVTTGWVTTQGNKRRTPIEQCQFQVDALYKHQLKTEYFSTQEEALGGPRHLEPMLAKGWDKAGKKLGMPWEWMLQPKLDGIRCLAKADGCFSRSGEKFLTTGPIEEALRPLFEANPDLVLDGELYNHDYHDRFNELSGLIRKGMNAKTPPTVEELSMAHSIMQYHVYDVPSHPGKQEDRLAQLGDLVAQADPYLVQMVRTIACMDEEQADRLYERWLEEGYEGMMYRRKSALYQYGKRPWDLLKRKQFETREFKIKRVEEGEGDWKGCVKRIVYEWDDGREFASGLRMSRASAAAWWGHHLAGVELWDSCTVRFMPPPTGAVPRVAVAIDYHGPEGRKD